MPVPERLVARHPHPLPIRGVAEGGVREDRIALVVGVETLRVQALAEVAVLSVAEVGEVVVFAPFRISLQCFL